MNEETIYQYIRRQGYSRRDFLKMCAVLAGTMGLRYVPSISGSRPNPQLSWENPLVKTVAAALESAPRLPVRSSTWA